MSKMELFVNKDHFSIFSSKQMKIKARYKTNELLFFNVSYFSGFSFQEAFNLIKVGDRWDCLETWYTTIASVSLLEFICAEHHRQGRVQNKIYSTQNFYLWFWNFQRWNSTLWKGQIVKRDLVKKLIEQADYNQHNHHKYKLEFNAQKKLQFLRKLWRLYAD